MHEHGRDEQRINLRVRVRRRLGLEYLTIEWNSLAAIASIVTSACAFGTSGGRTCT